MRLYLRGQKCKQEFPGSQQGLLGYVFLGLLVLTHLGFLGLFLEAVFCVYSPLINDRSPHGHAITRPLGAQMLTMCRVDGAAQPPTCNEILCDTSPAAPLSPTYTVHVHA